MTTRNTTIITSPWKKSVIMIDICPPEQAIYAANVRFAAISAGNTGTTTPNSVKVSGNPKNIITNFAVTAGKMP